MGTEVTAGTTTSLTWPLLKPGTYLLESGTHPSIQVPMGLIGVLVVTTAPSGTTPGTAYPGVGTAGHHRIPAVKYNAELPLEFSEIDPVQNAAVNTAVNTAGFSETKVWSGLPTDPQGNPGCGNPQSTTYNTCYPPAVNYTPFYFLINGVAFNKTSTASPILAVPGHTRHVRDAGITGKVLVRLVNAGVAYARALNRRIANDGLFGRRGGRYGCRIHVDRRRRQPCTGRAGCRRYHRSRGSPRADRRLYGGRQGLRRDDQCARQPHATALPIFARDLGLSGDSSTRDAGMIAYIGVNGAALPVAQGTGVFAAATANADTYDSLVAGQPFSVTDPSKGVIANDVNVYGVTLLAGPASGTLTCNARPQNPVPGICRNGTFTYTPTGTATSDTFTYCANGSVTAGHMLLRYHRNGNPGRLHAQLATRPRSPRPTRRKRPPISRFLRPAFCWGTRTRTTCL